jgi:HPt (histidine-containing phosphotransfer) domain-containing protein
MVRTEGPTSAKAKAAQADDEFEEVRQSFLSRLHGEQARLLVLTHAFETADENAASVLGDLEIFAHRLRGAAAVFHACALSEDAKVLELAAGAASIEPRVDNDPFVWVALRTLNSRLASINGNPASCAATHHPN